MPLATAAADVLRGMAKVRESEFIFPGAGGGPLSNMAMLAVLARMGRSDLTTHGFRSTFRDWAGDETNAAHETIEFCLAHGITDKTEAAYRRSDALKKRRELLSAWAQFCARKEQPRAKAVAPAGKVVALRAKT